MATYDSYKDSGVKWLGKIPSHWEMCANTTFLQEQKKNVGRRKDLDLLSLTLNGVIFRDKESGEGKMPSSFENYKIVSPNDIIFCLFDIDETPRTVGVAKQTGMITGAYDVFKVNDRALVDYIYYYYLSIDYCKALKPYYTGLRKTIKPTTFKHIITPIPPLNEQEAIVSYLDKVTADIDKAIEAQQKMIEALNERKQIIITRAVTRGLNPDAPLKDSGIDWLGQIPEHWDLVRTSLVFPYIGSGTTPSSSNQNYYADFGTPWLQTGDLNDNELTTSSRFITELALKDCNLRVYPSGSVVIAMYGATIGKTALLRFATTVNQACCVLPISSKCLSKFALYYFQGTKQALIQEANGGGQPNINQQLVRRHKLLLPSLNEQAEIISFIENSLIPINNAKLVCEQTISLLQERKQIIINEVVTGKKKVI